MGLPKGAVAHFAVLSAVVMRESPQTLFPDSTDGPLPRSIGPATIPPGREAIFLESRFSSEVVSAFSEGSMIAGISASIGQSTDNLADCPTWHIRWRGTEGAEGNVATRLHCAHLAHSTHRHVHGRSAIRGATRRARLERSAQQDPTSATMTYVHGTSDDRGQFTDSISVTSSTTLSQQSSKLLNAVHSTASIAERAIPDSASRWA